MYILYVYIYILKAPTTFVNPRISANQDLTRVVSVGGGVSYKI